MPHRVRIDAVLLVLALVLAAAGCDGSPTGESGIGSLRVSVSTTGEDLDLDGYVVRVDGVDSQTVSVAGTQVFSNLAAGEHLVELSGVAENCLASPGNSRSVTVVGGETAEVVFALDCVAIQWGQASVAMYASGPWDYGPEFGFAPESVTVTDPVVVTWTNDTGVLHNVTFAPATGAPANIPSYSSGSVARNFSTAGTFQYQCTIHAGMRGQVIVLEGTSPWDYLRSSSRPRN
jgi:plastocyanin